MFKRKSRRPAGASGGIRAFLGRRARKSMDATALETVHGSAASGGGESQNEDIDASAADEEATVAEIIEVPGDETQHLEALAPAEGLAHESASVGGEILVEAEELPSNEVDPVAVGRAVAVLDQSEGAPGNGATGSGYRVDDDAPVRHRFGEYVMRKGLISKDALHAASLEQQVTGAKIGQILVANGFLTDHDRVEAILETEHSRIAQEKVSRTKIPVEVLEEHSIMVAAIQEDRIYVASSQDERVVRSVVSEYYPDKEVEFVAYDASAINKFHSAMRKMSSVSDPSNSEELLLDRVVYHALGEGVSDIHIFPRAASYSIFLRQDGVNRLFHTGALVEYQTLIAKIKDRAAMDLAERRKPQDGGFQMEYTGRMIDLRVSTIPIAEGAEKCVIRLLDSDRVHPSLEKLGITDVEKWRKGLRHQFGICVICGPTGSGKTTTLNASVREMDRFGKTIYTVEDPVEYRIPYVAQVAVNKQVGLDFANAIRAFMRADPDVMIVGEVRDDETAANAIRAAETGHLVLVTLHTGSIVGAITRLKELGVEPHELRYLVRSIMVQTLVRKVCPACEGAARGGIECEACDGSGYKGRTVVSECEYFETPEDVERIIPKADRNITVTWTPKEQDAVNKMYAGITDRAELDRVFGPSVERYLREEDRR